MENKSAVNKLIEHLKESYHLKYHLQTDADSFEFVASQDKLIAYIK